MRLALTLLAFVLSVAQALGAPPADRMIRIGKLTSGEPPRWAMINDAFRAALAELGYVEGRNLQLIERTARFPDARMGEYARETS